MGLTPSTQLRCLCCWIILELIDQLNFPEKILFIYFTNGHRKLCLLHENKPCMICFRAIIICLMILSLLNQPQTYMLPLFISKPPASCCACRQQHSHVIFVMFGIILITFAKIGVAISNTNKDSIRIDKGWFILEVPRYQLRKFNNSSPIIIVIIVVEKNRKLHPSISRKRGYLLIVLGY